jgi:hypothetical protein
MLRCIAPQDSWRNCDQVGIIRRHTQNHLVMNVMACYASHHCGWPDGRLDYSHEPRHTLPHRLGASECGGSEPTRSRCSDTGGRCPRRGWVGNSCRNTNASFSPPVALVFAISPRTPHVAICSRCGCERILHIKPQVDSGNPSLRRVPSASVGGSRRVPWTGRI